MAQRPKPKRKTRSKKLAADETLRINTAGGVVRISQPSSSRKAEPTAREKAAVVVDLATPKVVNGFIDFLRERSVVGLAVGLVIGTQLKAIVDALNDNFINPIFGLLVDGGALSERVFTATWRGREADLGWGAIVYQIIDFVFVMIVIYVVIKFFQLDKLDKKKED